MVEVENYIAKCMKRQGFKYYPEPSVTVTSPIRTLDQVKLEGFGISISGHRSRTTPSENRSYFETLPALQAEEYVRLLSGPHDAKFLRDAGCRGAAESRYLPKPEFGVRINQLLDAMDKRMRNDPSYRQASGVYMSWMAEKGFPGKDGASLRAAIANEVDMGASASTLQAEERTAAVADFTCQSKQDEQLRTVRARYEGEFLRQNSSIVEQAMNGRLGR